MSVNLAFGKWRQEDGRKVKARMVNITSCRQGLLNETLFQTTITHPQKSSSKMGTVLCTSVIPVLRDGGNRVRSCFRKQQNLLKSGMVVHICEPSTLERGRRIRLLNYPEKPSMYDLAQGKIKRAMNVPQWQSTL